ncbi:peroxidase family protein [Desulfosarcina sp.]|uniref:peroxidase family protein n=1 Tax=Desulfosarcina sp. TaxID=2027861 RepID=UPI0039B9C860
MISLRSFSRDRRSEFLSAICRTDTGTKGERFARILGDQLERLRDGDRFWCEAYLPQFLLDIAERQTRAMIICRNTTIGNELPDDVFRVATEGGNEGAQPPSPAS